MDFIGSHEHCSCEDSILCVVCRCESYIWVFLVHFFKKHHVRESFQKFDWNLPVPCVLYI